ncbi:MAG: hypothetical protein QM704_07460 [Anaeromyxobacteraceae bacterium]
MRDRRFDWLYDRQKQPVREYILEKFAEELARELEAWPPAELEWVDDAARARWAAGAAARPREDVVRFALELARLDLAHALDGYECALEEGRHRLQTPAEEAALHLLVTLVTERCLELKERAEAARLSRADLSASLKLLERRLFRVTQ